MLIMVLFLFNKKIEIIDHFHATVFLERDKKLGVNEALTMAGRSRLRPILMTTLTTVVGMIPVALAIGSGMESNQGMGIVIVFGLTIGTMITLVFIPVLYSATNSIKNRLRKRHVRSVSPKDEAKKQKRDAKKAFKKGAEVNE